MFCIIRSVLSGFELLYFPHRVTGIDTLHYDYAIIFILKPLIISTSKTSNSVELTTELQTIFHLAVHVLNEASFLGFKQLNHIPLRNEFGYYSQISTKILKCALSILLIIRISNKFSISLSLLYAVYK